MEHGLNFDKSGQCTCLGSNLKLHLQQCYKYYGLRRTYFQKHWQRYLKNPKAEIILIYNINP